MLIIFGSAMGLKIKEVIGKDYENDEIIKTALRCLKDYKGEAVSIEELKNRIEVAFTKAAIIFGEFDPFVRKQTILDIHQDQRVMHVHNTGGGTFFSGMPIRLIFDALSKAFSSSEYSSMFFEFISATNLLKFARYFFNGFRHGNKDLHKRR